MNHNEVMALLRMIRLLSRYLLRRLVDFLAVPLLITITILKRATTYNDIRRPTCPTSASPFLLSKALTAFFTKEDREPGHLLPIGPGNAAT